MGPATPQQEVEEEAVVLLGLGLALLVHAEAEVVVVVLVGEEAERLAHLEGARSCLVAGLRAPVELAVAPPASRRAVVVLGRLLPLLVVLDRLGRSLLLLLRPGRVLPLAAVVLGWVGTPPHYR
jgi:hypothetical protein